MPGLKIRVGLSESLEVRGGPLTEEEVWALLCQCSTALQDTFLIGEAVTKVGHPAFVVTTDTLMLCGTGDVQFLETSLSQLLDQNYIPPEFYTDRHYQDADIEKMFVFMLGMALYNAVDYQLSEEQDLELSSQLDAVLSSMCEENPVMRHSLTGLLQACDEYTRTHPGRLASFHHIINLYKLVLGSEQELDSWYGAEDVQDKVYKPSRRRGDPEYKTKSKLKSQQKQRSRSHGTEDRGRRHQKDRPHPVGRDYEEPAHHSQSSLHINKLPSHHGSRPSLPANLNERRFQNRRVMSDMQLNLTSPHHRSNLSLSPGTFELSPSRRLNNSRHEPQSLQETYDKLRERRRKLQALRYGLSMNDLDDSDAASVLSDNTDYNDGKSLVSATSFTQGVFHPDLMSQYGSQVALQLGRDGDNLSDWMARHHATPSGKPGESQIPVPPLSMRAPARSRGASPHSGAPTPGPSGTTTPRGPSSRPVSAGRSKSRERAHISSKPREYPGPEFVRKAAELEVNLSVPYIRSINPSNLRNVKVVLLNGQKLNILCEANTTERQVFDVVISHIGLPEHYFFDLTILQEGEHFFIPSDTKLHKVAPPGWKEGKSKSHTITFTLYFRVKFYVSNLSMLKHELTRHLMYLQLRRDLLEERIWCKDENSMLLAALAVQAEYGDDDHSNTTTYFMCEHYVAPRCLRRLGSAYIKDHLPDLQRNYYGMEQSEAELSFIKEAQQLPEYGIHFYKIYKSKKEMLDPLFLGISVQGALIAHNRSQAGGQRSVISRHPWAYTQKISFHRHRFSIQPKSEAGPYKPAKLNFYTDSYKKGRYFVQLCTSHHSFQMKMKSRANITNMFEQEFPVAGEEDEAEGGVFDVPATDYDDSYAYDEQGDHAQEYPDASTSPLPSMPRTRYSTPGHGMQFEDSSPLSSRRDPSGHMSVPEDLDTNNRSQDVSFSGSTSYPGKRETPDRRVITVNLKKVPQQGIGVNLLGGENMGKLDLGIFVESVTPGGPAARDGRLRRGDRIIAINGQSLEGMQDTVARDLIQQSPPDVLLVVSQSADPYPDYNGNSELEDSLEDITVSSSVQVHHDDSQDVYEYLKSKMMGLQEQVRSVEGRETPGVITRGDKRASTSNSSELDIERVLPPQALKPEYIQQHMQPTPAPVAANPASEQFSKPDDDSDSEIDEALRHITERSRQEGYMPSPDGASSQQDLKPGDRYEAVLKKHNGSLGLNVTGGINTSVKHGGIYVKSYNPVDGSTGSQIQPGDRVLEVNGVSLMGVTHKQAVETLRNAPDTCHLVLSRGTGATQQATSPASLPSDLSSSPIDEDQSSSIPDYSFVTSDQTFELELDKENDQPQHDNQGNVHVVNLDKGTSGLGFSVQGGVGWHQDPQQNVVRVRKVYPVGPAAESGRLQEGDVLLQVDGHRLKHLSHQEVLTVLRRTENRVKLLVCRPDPDVLPPIIKRESPYSQSPEQGLTSSSTTPDTIHSAKPVPSFSQAVKQDVPALKTLANKSEDEDSYVEKKEEKSLKPHYDNVPSIIDSYVEKKEEKSLKPHYDNVPSIIDSFEDKSSDNDDDDDFDDFDDDDDEGAAATGQNDNVSEQLLVQDDGSEVGDDDTLRPGEFEVTLNKGDKGLGFTVAGGQHTTGYFYVKDILYEPALSCGNIRPGDRLIKVNDVDMRGLNHREAVSYLRETPTTVTIRFYRPEQETEVAEITENLRNARKDDTKVVSNINNKVEEPVSPRYRESSPSMAVVQPYSYERQNLDAQPSRSHVQQSDALSPGSDKMSPVSWGDTSLPMPDDDEAQLLKAIDRLTRHGQHQAGLVQVELDKPVSGGLGINLIAGEKAGTSALFIRNIVPGSVADLDGTLQVGDRLLQVNGESVIGVPHSKAAAMVKQAQSHISLVVGRPVSRQNTPHLFDDMSDKEHSVDTDSDVDSATLDEDAEVAAHMAKGFATASSENADDEEVAPDMVTNLDADDSFDSDTEAYEKFVKHAGYKKQVNSDDEIPDSFAQDTADDTINMDLQKSPGSSSPYTPPKPPRRNQPGKRLPASISEEWLEAQVVLQVPQGSLLYTGSQLHALIRNLHTAITNDDPVEEYKKLKHAKLTDNCNDAKKPENRTKNRYRNVLPYDATRVYLSGPEDYINANHVRVSLGREMRHYIACQGPLPQTTGDFWRMVWETQATIIAMVTLDVESGKVKCHRYWPDSIGSPFTVCNRYELSLTQVQSLHHFDIHHIKMEDLETGRQHRVSHLNFTSWPDQGSPDSALPLLRYIKFMHLAQGAGPIIVHCSAGIGRTGALITIDTAIALIEKDLKVDIEKIVNDLRMQRQGMIQTKEQYVFCYKAVLEALETLVPHQPDTNNDLPRLSLAAVHSAEDDTF